MDRTSFPLMCHDERYSCYATLFLCLKFYSPVIKKASNILVLLAASSTNHYYLEIAFLYHGRNFPIKEQYVREFMIQTGR